jgi:hypothetical protein
LAPMAKLRVPAGVMNLVSGNIHGTISVLDGKTPTFPAVVSIQSIHWASYIYIVCII